MKDVYEVLRHKELEVSRLQKEPAALRVRNSAVGSSATAMSF